jgi:hypothetical protein
LDQQDLKELRETLVILDQQDLKELKATKET